MKKRIISIMNTSRKKTRIAFLCVALVLTATFLSGFVFSVGGLPVDTEDKALEKVLAETGGGTVVKCELDYLGGTDSGIEIYEMEVINGDTKYEIEIGADDLVIYSYEEKTSKKTVSLPADTDITPEKAIEIALAKTAGGEATKWELSVKDGTKTYKIEIAGEDTKYTMNVGASDGEITNYKEKAVKASKKDKSTVSKPVLISAAEAKEIALAEIGGKIDECELDYEKGAWIYEIEIILGGTEYEIEINAETGEILKSKIDD